MDEEELPVVHVKNVDRPEPIQSAKVKVIRINDAAGVTFVAVCEIDGEKVVGVGPNGFEAVTDAFHKAYGTTKFSLGDQAAFSPLLQKMRDPNWDPRHD